MNASLEEAFFRELASHLDYWSDAGARMLTDPDEKLVWCVQPEPIRRLRAVIGCEHTEDVREAVKQLLYGQLHSLLVSFDGGTSLVERHQLKITDQTGEALGSALHEDFTAYLFKTGRLK